MEITTIQKYIHTSPRKLRLVADMARKMQPMKAITILKFTSQYAASDLTKAIQTALANAKIHGLAQDSTHFKSIEINEGPKMRRYRPASKGRALPFKRKMAHIKIILTDEVENVDKESKRKEKK